MKGVIRMEWRCIDFFFFFFLESSGSGILCTQRKGKKKAERQGLGVRERDGRQAEVWGSRDERGGMWWLRVYGHAGTTVALCVSGSCFDLINRRKPESHAIFTSI